MKKIISMFIGFILSLFLGTGAWAEDYLVIGAGTAAVNGIYTYNSTDDMWDYDNGSDRLSIYYLGCDSDWRRKWMIVPRDYNTGTFDRHSNLYTTIFGDATDLPVNGWYANPRGYSLRGYDPAPFVSVLNYLPAGSDQDTANVKFACLNASQTTRTSFTANWFVDTSNVSAYSVYLWFSESGWQLVTPLTTDGGISSMTISGLSPDTSYDYYLYVAASVNGQSIGSALSDTITVTTHPDAYYLTGSDATVLGTYEYSGTYNGKPKYKKYDAYNYFLGYYKENAACDQSLPDDCANQKWALLIDGTYDIKYEMHKSTFSLELPLESYVDTYGDPMCVWDWTACTTYNLALSKVRLTPSAPTTVTAANMQTTSFTANWNAVATATGYELDVATDSNFSSYVSGYNGKVIANGNTYDTVTGLTPNTAYYFRVRSYYQGQVTLFESVNSATAVATTWAPSSVTTQSVSGVGTTTATGNGNITELGNPLPTQHGIVWDIYANPTIALNSKTENGPAVSTGPFTAAMSALSPYTDYYARAYVTNSVGTAYGNQVSFRTGAVAPSLSTLAVSSVTDTTATGNGDLTDLGIPNPTQHGIVWDTTPNPTTSLSTKTESGSASATGPFSGAITGLVPNTFYYVRAYATNAAGTVYGGEVGFITEGTAASITTEAVTEITTTSAVGHGTISILSIPAPTQHGIVWSTSSGPTVDLGTKTENGPAVAIGSFSAALTGLDPATTYYVRAYATNTLGTAYGNEVFFTTPGILPVVTTQSVTDIATNNATGNGTILNLGVPDPVQHGIVWDTLTLPTIEASSKSENGPASVTGQFSSTVSGLLPYTTYYVRAYATNTAGTAYGNQVGFTTPGIAPAVTTQAVSNITATTATIGGDVTDLGIPDPTQYGFVWDVSADPTVELDTKTENGAVAATGPYSDTLTGLSPYTTYYARAYATNATGTTYGVQVTFTTLGVLPVVTTQSASDITSTTATGNGMITDLGAPNATQHGFVWGTSTNPTLDLLTKTENGPASAVGSFSNTLAGLVPNTLYYVRAYATNTTGIVYGNTENFTTAGLAPVISHHPVSMTLLSGQSVTFSVIASGTEPLSYQWRKDDQDIPGANASQYEIPAVDDGDTGQYACVITNAFGSVTSDAATLSISQLLDVYQISGAGVAGANGYYQDSGRTYNGKPVYEQPGYIMGYRNCAYGDSTWVILDSSDDSDLAGLGEGNSFSPLYRNDTDLETPPVSGWVAVHLALPYVNVPFVNKVMPPSIVAQPQSLSVQIGATAAFSVTVTGGTPLSYQWQKDGIDMGGETEDSLTISPVGAGDVGAYTCRVSNRAGTVSSDAAHLFIGETLSILTQPESQTVSPGESVTFSISAFGVEPLFYQWRKDGVDIAGATGTTYSISAVAGGDVGAYTCVVSNDFGSVTSVAAALTVLGPANIEDQPDSQVKYLGQSVTFSVTASGTQPITYQWMKDGAAIDGAAAATLTLSGLLLSDAGEYTCMVDNGIGQDESDAATLEVYVNDAPVITGQAPDPLTTARAMPFTVLLQNLVVEDDNDNYPEGFTLTVMAGDEYTLAGHEVTPLAGFDGDELRVPVSVHDGTDASNVYLLSVAINAVEPVIAEIFDGPASVTRAESYALKVGGDGVAAYKYRVDGGLWSQAADVGTPLTLTLGEGYHHLEVVGGDDSGNWQSPNRATGLHWTIDTTPPVAVLTNAPSGTVGTTAVRASVGGVDVRYYRYRLDDGDWGPVLPVDRLLVVSGLAEGGHTLAVIGLDTAGNWADAPGAQGTVAWVVDKTVPTAILSNLPESVTAETTAGITVGWETDAPAVDQYKYSLDGGVTWHLGSGQTITLDDAVLGEGANTIFVNAYNQGLDRWQDGGEGETTANATAYTWQIDLTAPEAPVLSAAQAIPAATAVTLLWSAGESELKGYRLYVAEHVFDDSTLNAADTYYVGLEPGPEDRVAAFRAAGLWPGTTYYFGVKAVDKAGNLSGLSNIAVCTTADILPRIMTAGLAGGGSAGDNTVARTLIVSGANFMKGDGNVVRFSCPPRTFSVSGTSTDGRTMTVEVPCGAPVGIYKLKVLNTNGISRDCTSTYTVLPAPVKPPEVIDVQPATISADADASIVITGSHFVVRDLPAHAVALIAADGRSVPVDVFDVQHSGKIAAMIPSGLLDRGVYGISVTTVDGGNDVSTAQLEVVAPIDASTSGTGSQVSSQGIDMSRLGAGDTAEGTLPAAFVLKTPHGDNSGEPMPGRLKITAAFAPGTRIFYDEGITPPRSYDGAINPPRQIAATLDVAETVSRPAHAAVFQMGSSYPLMLGEGQTVFMSIDMALPDTADPPLVYVLTPEGEIEPAGIDGAWMGDLIDQGGTILAERPGQPEPGYTAYTVGVLLDHLSTFVVGTLETDGGQSANPPLRTGDDSESAVGCFVESAGDR